MVETLTTILSEIGDVFVDTLTKYFAQEVKFKLQANSAKYAFELALGHTIRLYASSGFRLCLARPLLKKKDNFLKQPVIADELTHLMRFEREPNAKLIGQLWKVAMDNSQEWYDFTSEAKWLLECLQIELRRTEVFRPVFDTKRLDAIVASTAASTTFYTRMEEDLANLVLLMDSRFSGLIGMFAGASFNLREQISDYTSFINDRASNFVGRQSVFDALTHFTNTQPCGYFFIRGDPGIGKSALAAQMVKSGGYVHHFNIKSQGISNPKMFLRNICAQLIVTYALAYTNLPAEATLDASFLNILLNEISNKIPPGEKVIIVIDALDEVDNIGVSVGTNLLYLPLALPQGIYIVATTRKIPLALHIACEQNTLDIEHNSEENMHDIHAYLEGVIGRPGIQRYITKQGIDNELFIKYLQENAEGNFMYLQYVLPEIEYGAYQDLGLNALPTGLQNYYQNHWVHMRSESDFNDESWFKYKVPVIMALAIVEEPVSIDMLANFSGVQERPRIREILQELAPFVSEVQDKRYRLYHASFQDFVTNREDIDLKDAHKKIVEYYWSKLVGGR